MNFNLEDSDLDNGALHHISHNMLKQQEVKYGEKNWILLLVMSIMSSGIGKINGGFT